MNTATRVIHGATSVTLFLFLFILRSSSASGETEEVRRSAARTVPGSVEKTRGKRTFLHSNANLKHHQKEQTKLNKGTDFQNHRPVYREVRLS